ncbi:MAG: tetratricopeptide repeat protein [Candidatus Eremiobacteraeota bacterium]|nr:tetratricopeptide repeat protein [Candidatus Eremiobacteraeota bacterium]
MPTGTVTFLFTDIEGSTQRWETHREAMPAAVKRHDELLRGSIETNGGYVFKTVGDAFCAVFDSVAGAASAALDIQRALSGEDFTSVGGLRARVAMHTGNCEERNGDYFGPAVNRVARLLSVGHGGQILLSDATAALAKADLPPRSSMRDLGSHRLKDLSNPEHVHQLIAPDIAADFPPLRSLEAIPNNLPIQVTSFRGREADMQEISEALDTTRLVTLFGAGGVGKTRLALQVAAELLDRFPDGVWYLELAPITDPEFVPTVIAGLLNAPEAHDRSVTETLLNFLKRKRMLLILDNCEHMVEAVSTLVAAILHSCPDVRILATSRQAFNIAGEDVIRVASLAAPDPTSQVSADTAMEFGAVALFVDRATSVNRTFRLSDDMASTVADICRRLDGIPMAIELAAARVKVLSIPHLAQRLSERFRILSSGDRTVLKRQQTMRALIDWSYDLLTETEKLLFRRLSVFAGGFSLDAASDVCSGGNIDAADILDLISSLVDKSLIVAETGGDVERYRLLESTREYAIEKLTESGERDQFLRSHAHYFLTQAREADESWPTTPRAAWLSKVRSELDNFRAALDWTLIKKKDGAAGAALAGSLGFLWYDGGLEAEGRRWIQTATALSFELPDDVTARLCLALAALCAGKESYEAATRAVKLYDQIGDRKRAALARTQVGFALFQLGRANEAFEPALQAVSILRLEGGPRVVSAGLTILGLVQWIQGEVEAGRRSYSEAIALAKGNGDDRRVAIILQNLAELECTTGNVARAIEYANEAQAIYERDHDEGGQANVGSNLGAYLIFLERFSEARDTLRRAVRYLHETELPYNVVICTQSLALVAATNNAHTRAARLLGFADAQYQKLEIQREPTEAMIYDRLMKLLRTQLNDTEIAALRAEGAALTEDQAVAEALTD